MNQIFASAFAQAMTAKRPTGTPSTVTVTKDEESSRPRLTRVPSSDAYVGSTSSLMDFSKSELNAEFIQLLENQDSFISSIFEDFVVKNREESQNNPGQTKSTTNAKPTTSTDNPVVAVDNTSTTNTNPTTTTNNPVDVVNIVNIVPSKTPKKKPDSSSSSSISVPVRNAQWKPQDYNVIRAFMRSNKAGVNRSKMEQCMGAGNPMILSLQEAEGLQDPTEIELTKLTQSNTRFNIKLGAEFEALLIQEGKILKDNGERVTKLSESPKSVVCSPKVTKKVKFSLVTTTIPEIFY